MKKTAKKKKVVKKPTARENLLVHRNAALEKENAELVEQFFRDDKELGARIQEKQDLTEKLNLCETNVRTLVSHVAQANERTQKVEADLQTANHNVEAERLARKLVQQQYDNCPYVRFKRFLGL